jgi:DNA-binding transcriptional MerR regulator
MLQAAQKSPEAFRTISEVAAELDVPQHVLRFWETKFIQVKPLKRAGGRRYYRPDDLDLLRGIQALLYSHGLTIKGVQKILREQGARYVIGMGRGEISLVRGREKAQAKSEVKFVAPLNVHPFRLGETRAPEMRDFDDVQDEGANEAVDEGAAPGDGAGRLSAEESAQLEGLLGELLALKKRLAAPTTHPHLS